MAQTSSDGDNDSDWCFTEDTSKSFWVSNEHAYNLLVTDLKPGQPCTLQDIVNRSDAFSLKFPVQTVRCAELQKRVPKEKLETYINSVYPVVHERVLQLYAEFLVYKSGPAGSKVERDLYKDMTLVEFVDRLLTKRPACFLRREDSYMLLDRKRDSGQWETIGTDSESPPLVLKDYISYDEIKLSALLSVSSYTHFINVGDRKNRAVYAEDRTNIQDEGVIVGLIGPRMARKFVMDYQELVHESEQSVEKSLHLDMYGEPPVKFADLLKQKESPSWRKMVKTAISHRFTEFKPQRFFDNAVYAKRITLSFDVLLYEANERAKARNTTAYVHLVGIGLGVWRISVHQNKLFVDTCLKRIEELGQYLHNISDIRFAWMQLKTKCKYSDGDKVPIDGHPNGGICVYFNQSNPNEKLEAPHEGKLLVVSYAWDGNALPGNEFWKGCLGSSGDSSTASCTQITELHNPHINPMVCGSKLRIVTKKGLVHLKEFQKHVKEARESSEKKQ